MIKFIRRLTEEEAVRYLFFGGCTTGVNFAVFSALRYAGAIPVNMANLVSIAASIVFAFFVNRFLVFGIMNTDVKEMLTEFTDFAGMRAGTLLTEFFGMWFLCGYAGFSDFWSKGLIQIAVIILNYIISKFFVFGESRIGGAANE